MKCPRCGESAFLMQRTQSLSNPGVVVCLRCGYRGYDGGSPYDDPSPAASAWFGIQRIYTWHGIVTWLLASIALFFVWIAAPQLFLTHQYALLRFAAFSLICSMVLGWSVGVTVFLSGLLVPRSKLIHLVAPLSVAAAVGSFHGYMIAFLIPKGEDLALIFHSPGIRVLSGAVLAMLATPIIIIRSAKMMARKGYRPPLDSSSNSGDKRWVS